MMAKYGLYFHNHSPLREAIRLSPNTISYFFVLLGLFARKILLLITYKFYFRTRWRTGRRMPSRPVSHDGCR